jgi:hypothetical protein
MGCSVGYWVDMFNSSCCVQLTYGAWGDRYGTVWWKLQKLNYPDKAAKRNANSSPMKAAVFFVNIRLAGMAAIGYLKSCFGNILNRVF